MQVSRTVVSGLMAIGLCAGAVLYQPASAEGAATKASTWLVQKKIPKRLSEGGLLRFARSNNARRLQETQEADIASREWKAEMVTSFNRPPGDFEFQVMIYDVHSGPRQFVDSMPVMISNRTDKTFVNRVKFQRPKFKPNRKMELVVVLKRREIGRMKFETVGERVRHSGQVDFSVSDTRGR